MSTFTRLSQMNPVAIEKIKNRVVKRSKFKDIIVQVYDGDIRKLPMLLVFEKTSNRLCQEIFYYNEFTNQIRKANFGNLTLEHYQNCYLESRPNLIKFIDE